MKKYTSDFDENLSIIENKQVIKIEEQNKEYAGKFKTVFYIPSKTNPQGKMCIAWHKTHFKLNDYIDLKGRFKDDVFIAYSTMIRFRANK